MKKLSISPIHIYFIALFIVWSSVIAGLNIWKMKYNEQVTLQFAENEARANFNKDKAFRLWLTNHGRVYVPIGEKYQPDPYLAHIPERDITTDSGMKLSMINPARIIRELDEQFNAFFGVAVKVTSLNPLRPGNAPDEWEKQALVKIDQGVKEVFEYTSINNQPYLRLIQPLPIEPGCLLCHVQMAQKTNGIGGGVTIAIPMKEFFSRQRIEDANNFRLYVTIWLIGSLIILFAYINLLREAKEKEKVISALTSSEIRNKGIMDSALDCIITIDSESIVTEVNPAVERTFGYSRKEMIGSNLAQLIIPQEFRERHLQGIQSHLQGDGTRILGSRIEITAEHADGHQMPVELAVTRINQGSDVFFTAYLRDLTEAHKLKQELTYQASHDALTGLMNRRVFEERLEHLIELGEVDSHHCLLFMDFDQFKVVNDSSGHVAGDELLRQLSRLLQQNKRISDTLARLGGDEFALLLEGCSLKHAQTIASNLIEAIQQYNFYWEEKIYNVGLSIGLVPFQGQGTNYSDLMSAADAACYKSKQEGGNRYFVFTPDNEELSRQRGQLDWISRIQNATQENQFVLYRQNIKPIQDNETVNQLHCEILLRLRDPDGSIIGPDQFIPAAERYNLMKSVDKWVIENTFRWLSLHKDEKQPMSFCSINLSGNSITDDAIADFITSTREKYDLPAHMICFEITETVAITNLVKATRFLDRLHQQGFLFALDDFGSGVSSFGYLKNLPVDYLKIEGEFVRDITTNPINLAMVKSINEIGQVMGKQTIAEYVEDEETVKLLKEIGVDFVQGFVFSRPGPLE